MKPSNILEVVSFLGQIKTLSILITEGNTGQEARWQALQNWLAKYPSFDAQIKHCLFLPPMSAVDYLAEQWEIDPSLLDSMDRNGQIRKMAAEIIRKLQILYISRASLENPQ